MGVAWSLEVEVQFYIIAPLLFGIFRFGKTARRGGLLLLAAFAILIQQVFRPETISLLNYLQYFLGGMLVADLWVSGWRPKWPKPGWNVLGLILLVLALGVLFTTPPPAERTLLHRVVVPVLTTVIVALGLFAPSVKRLLSIPVIATIGGMCYSIYLLHYLVIGSLGFENQNWFHLPSTALDFAAQFAVYSVATLLGCGLFYALVERPFMGIRVGVIHEAARSIKNTRVYRSGSLALNALLPLRFRRLFFLFWALTAAIYALSWRSGFERDFHGWLEMYTNLSFQDCLNRKGAGITSLYQVTQLQLWVWTRLFGHAPLPWFLVMTGLHAAAISLTTVFVGRALKDFGVARAETIALAGGLFTLLAPHSAEVIVWKASYHYPMAVLFSIGTLRCIQKYLHDSRGRWLLLAVLIYAVSTFTLELFYTTIPLAVALLLCYGLGGMSTPRQRTAVITRALLPMLGLFIFHLVLYRMVYGGVLPHTEGLMTTAARNPGSAFARILPYEFHLLLQGRYWSGPTRQKIYDLVSNPAVGWAAFIAIAATLLLLLVRFRTASPRWRAAALLSFCAVPGLFIVLPYWIPTLGIYYNDRYLYFMSLFQWPLVALLLFAAGRRRGYVASGALLLILVGCTAFTVIQCRREARVFWGALQDFPRKQEPVTHLLLNVPANLDGIVAFQASPDMDEFNSHLRIFTGDSARGRIQSVAGFNMVKWWDGAHVTMLDRTHLKVTLNQWGTWWFNGTLGASDHETDLYRARFTDPGHEYELELKDTSVQMLYFNGGQWHEVDRRIADSTAPM
jgi:hypothetical protein